jgi:hypothetical protein
MQNPYADLTEAGFAESIARGPWAWPGGYPVYYITSDGASLSYEAAESHRDTIAEAIRTGSKCGWRVVAEDINWENPCLICDHTGRRIPSAYAEDEANA